MSIQVSQISKLYGTQRALDDISFEIKAGDIVGFLGPNGAGKSTMMKIITGFIPQTSGKVWVNGLDVSENSIEIRKRIGYLPEQNPLYYDMYVREYLEFAAGLYKLDKVQQRVKDIIEKVGLSVEQGKKIGALSKGYKQRVGLAQALIHNPDVLILDEPTSGLDPNQIIEIRNLISEVGKEKTVMLSTHIMQEVEAVCDHVIIINKGKIVANDSAENLQVLSSENQSIVVEFKEAIENTILKNIKGVAKVSQLKANRFLIESTTNKDLRPEIFAFAVQKQLTLLTMFQKERTLENVFRELTQNPYEEIN